jgi:hypothetical protein
MAKPRMPRGPRQPGRRTVFKTEERELWGKTDGNAVVLPASLSMALMGDKVHYTFSNLEHHVWQQGKTLCRRTGLLFRFMNGESVTQPICLNCNKRLEHQQEEEP